MNTPGDTSIFEKDSLLGGRYRLDEPLAGGGMAEVWRSHDTILDRAVAVKLLHPHLAGDATVAERFRREAISAARLSHPHIVPTFDTGVDGETAFIVMGLVHGSTVRELLGEGSLTPRAAAAIGRQVTDALAYAHSHGIIHRDIKPTNVLVVDGNSRVMVADFGIAKAIESSTDPSLTLPGLVIGTPAYAAPEQLRGESLDGRTDVYAAGVLIHEMACGHTENTDQATQMGVAGEQTVTAVACPQLPTELAGVVAKATAESPDDRYETALAMRDDLADVERRLYALEAAIAQPTTQSQRRPVTSAPRTVGFTTGEAAAPKRKSHGARQSRIALVVMIILVIGAAGFGKFFGSLGSDDDPTGTNPAPSVSGLQATSFDPLGDGTEHENEASNAVDGNASTAWTTETYNDRRFGIKPGVGLRIRLGESRQLVSMNVASGSQGWAAQIFVKDGNPSDLNSWGSPVDTQSGLGADASFDLHSATGDSVLLWITDLGQDRRFSATEISISSRT